MNIPVSVKHSSVSTVIGNLLYEHGMSTLSQTDSNFHPYHEFPPYYVKDAAYHNGTVWTWMNGPAYYAATRYDLQDVVFPVFKNSIHQILNRGSVGTLSELLDAHPKNGNEPKLSGTYSQAWSLAEFIRSWYQDFLGVSVDATTQTIRLQPKLPSEISDIKFTQRLDSGSVDIAIVKQKEKVVLSFVPNNIRKPYRIDYLWVFENGNAVSKQFQILPTEKFEVEHTEDSMYILTGDWRNRNKKNEPFLLMKNFSEKKYFGHLTLAVPDTNKKYSVLKKPSHALLTHEQVKKNVKRAPILFAKKDSIGDDSGEHGTYTYPKSLHFKKGILDITASEFRYDDKYLYCSLSFANLTDPGWHPEYGFQLTIAAIAINTGKGKSSTVIRFNTKV
jgi:hypothetical protein